ncbi:hypothetical protein [Haloferax prahovense]|uniref:hypothetical protein n=1 Tax=Haloferax prahovense TaxID=381852 RepID=UPI001267D9C5|nr:hypothetical protein [Haloferax prahovense]
MSEPELVLTTKPSDDPVASSPPTLTTSKDLHQYLFNPWKTGLTNTLIKATHDVVAGSDCHTEALRDAGVKARYGAYAATIAAGWCHPRYVEILYSSRSISKLKEKFSPFWLATHTTRQLAKGTLIMGATPRGSLEQVYNGPFAVFRASTITPRVNIQIDETLWDHRRSTRNRLVQYLVQMAKGCQVHVVGPTYWINHLYRDHRDQLSTAVSEIRDPEQIGGYHIGDQVWEQVRAALADCPPSNDIWTLVKLLNNRENGLYSYRELYQRPELPGGNSRKRQLIADLYQYSLAERVTVAGDSHVALLPAGEVAYQRYQQEYGEQTQLEGFTRV